MKRFLNLLIVLPFFLVGCSSSQDCEKHEKEIIGISSVVGNTPFTEVAIITDQNDVYLVKSPDNIKNILSNNQGHYFKVKYINTKDSANIHIIIPTEIKKQQ